jgi:hypothetical protein
MPTVVYGTALVPPRSENDCACTFCGLFRAHHYWLRAVTTTVVTVLLALGTWRLDTYLRDQQDKPADVLAVIGTLMVVVTGAVVLTIVMWYKPVRRLSHRLRPRPQAEDSEEF